ncbi:L-histidine N(alpha)-methyltransferase [Actinomycetospora sp. NBRC 106378]|uniref:L-histidine N(alpha)-methyltransferase n=1 Tax=Actinomycetospora sp. NBRC 106378 TaxID=3032208 RepID=UPI0024A20136|nr:L-histidine N(alpha)-methyltransferase [Actinomycetospora sp. NBRC 106378]GLZ52341.1 histidine N-alpha-methyltransferase [Actinomycetospora sp. NBRC 106378]
MTPHGTLPTVDVHLTEADADAALRADALRGLTSTPKVLRPQWLYDARGSELFEQITAQPEYYPFVAEREALAAHADEIARTAAADTFVELGSGSSTKSTLLLDAMSRTGLLRHYVPVDVSAAALEEAVPGLVAGYPDLDVHGVVGDFIADLRSIPAVGRRLVVLLGGTIGNFEPEDRRAFLTALSDTLTSGEHFLVGTDLIKDEETLVAAYDDRAGVTAAFELNALTVLNRVLGADFDVDGFSYVAAWVPQSSRIEMRVKARRPMTVHVPALDLTVEFAEGEEMRTEISTKFTRQGIAAELDAAGFDAVGWLPDPGERFGLTLARRR